MPGFPLYKEFCESRDHFPAPSPGPSTEAHLLSVCEGMKIHPEEMRCPEAKLRLLLRISFDDGCEIKGPRIVETPSCF